MVHLHLPAILKGSILDTIAHEALGLSNIFFLEGCGWDVTHRYKRDTFADNVMGQLASSCFLLFSNHSTNAHKVNAPG
jgi:hypothetical protein